jgi:hypothetical protein
MKGCCVFKAVVTLLSSDFLARGRRARDSTNVLQAHLGSSLGVALVSDGEAAHALIYTTLQEQLALSRSRGRLRCNRPVPLHSDALTLGIPFLLSPSTHLRDPASNVFRRVLIRTGIPSYISSAILHLA